MMLSSAIGKVLQPCRGVSSNFLRNLRHFSSSSNFAANSNIQLQLSSYRFDNYEAEVKNFNLHIPNHFNFSRDFIDQWARVEKTGERNSPLPAFWWIDDDFKTEIKWSFQDLSSISKRVANAFIKGCGLNRGDKVIVILPKVPEWWLINLACIRADLILSPGTSLLRSKDIKFRLEMSEAKCIITHPDLVDFVDTASESTPLLQNKIVVGEKSQTRPGWLNFQSLVEKGTEDFETADTLASDPMTLFFTSGTTGDPKMCEHTHASYGLGHTLTARYMLMADVNSVVWNMSDTGWAKCAWSSVFAPWIHGACVFVHNSTAFDPEKTLKVLSDYPITHLCAAPTVMRVLVKQPLKNYSFKALKHCISAGEPVNPELVEEWKIGTGLDTHEAYGQTETTLICTRPPCIPYKPGSTGKPSPGLELHVIDDDGKVLEDPGTEGNLAIKVKPHRPVSLFSSYLNNPEKTASVHIGDYYFLGDRGYVDEEGYIFFIGRSDDVILSSGYRIGPFEVESAILEHPAVLESAVVSSPDEVRGEVVKAFVTLVPGYAVKDYDGLTKELQDHVKSVTAPYKYPRKIEYVKELPKTISGKIRRVELRNKEWKKD